MRRIGEGAVIRWVGTGKLYSIKIFTKALSKHTEAGALNIIRRLGELGIRALAQCDFKDGKNQMRTIMNSDGEKDTWNKRETHKGAR